MPKSTTFKLSAESGQFVGEVGKATKAVGTYDGATQKAKKSAGEFGEAVADGAKKLAAYGAAAAAAGAAVTAAMVKQGLASVDALAKTADKLGVSTEALASLRHAAELTGVSTGKFDVALQRMTRRLADAASGSGPAVDALKALGLSAEQLIKLSPDQAFARIADQMNNVENQSQKVSLAFKLFDSEGVGLVNTLKLGSDGLAAMAAEADAAGLALSRIDAAKVEMANDAIFRVKQLTTGFSQQLAVQFAPVLEGIADRLFGVGKEAGGMAKVAESAFNYMIKASGVVADVVNGLRVVWLGIRNVIAEVINLFIQYITIGARAGNAIAEFTGKTENAFSQALADVTEFADSFQATIEGFRDEFSEALMAPVPSTALAEFTAEVKRQYEAQAIAAINAQGSVREGVITTGKVIDRTTKTTTKTVKKESDEFAKAWEKATERIDKTFASAWEGAFDGFTSFRDSLLDAFKRLLAEMAHLAITKPILISLGLGGGSSSALGSVVGGSGGGVDLTSLSSLLNAKTYTSALTSSLASLGGAGIGFVNGAGELGTQALYKLGFRDAASSFSVGASGYANTLVESGQSIGGFFGAENLSTNAAAGVGMIANAVAGYAGSWVGNKAGEALFGKQAESSWGASIGGAIGSIWGPVGTLIGSALGGLVDTAFGGDGKKRAQVGVDTAGPEWRQKYAVGDTITTTSGLQLTARSLRGGKQGGDIALALRDSFALIDTALVSTFSTLTGEVVDFTDQVLGKRFRNADGSRNNETQFNGFFGADGFNGLDGGELAGAPDEFVRQWVAAANEQLGTELNFQPIFDLAREGELLADVLIRVQGEFAAVNPVIESLGFAVFDLSVQGMAAADGLVQAFGGLDNLLAGTSDYYAAFYSAEEKFNNLVEQLNLQAEALGFVLPETREGFRDLVDGLNLADAAAQQQFAALMTLVPALDQYYTQLEAVAEGVGGVSDSIGDAADELFARIAKSMNSVIDDLALSGSAADRQRRDRAQEFVQSQIKAGTVTDEDALERALDVLRQDSSALFGDYTEYQRDVIRTRNSLLELQGILDGTITPEYQRERRESSLMDKSITGKISDFFKGGMLSSFAGGGVHSGGVRLVGELGPELEFTGPSRIMSNGDLVRAMSNEEVVKELRALRGELRTSNLAVAKNTMKSMKYLERWEIDGMPAERT